MAMLSALNTQLKTSNSLLSTFNFKLFVFHVEHGLRSSEESRGDAEFVRSFCKEQGIPCRIKHIPPGKIVSFAKRKGIGIEAAARHFRYKALSETAQKLKNKLSGETPVCILTAHTKDDAIELTLMRILRGCGPAGLAFMTERRDFGLGTWDLGSGKREEGKSGCELGTNQVVVCRPLLELTRADVIAYLTAKRVSWREDATNADLKFLRNRVRGKLAPLLDENFPSWKKGVSAMAQTQSFVAEFIAEEAQKRVRWNLISKNSLSTDASGFFSQPQIIREEAIFQAVDILLKKVKNYRTVKRAVARKFCSGAANAVNLGAVKVKCKGESIIISCDLEEFFEKGVSHRLCI